MNSARCDIEYICDGHLSCCSPRASVLPLMGQFRARRLCCFSSDVCFSMLHSLCADAADAGMRPQARRRGAHAAALALVIAAEGPASNTLL